VAEAVFAREQIEKFPLEKPLANLAVFRAPFSWLPEDFLMSDGPRDRRYRNRKNEEFDYLVGDNFHVPGSCA
jgi:hypothetical protein